MQIKYTFLIVVFYGLIMQVQAQEQLLELQIDPGLNNYHRSHHLLWKNQEKNEASFLPFFEDFNQEEFRPEASKWIGDNVYVNKKYQLLPPDLGVATFDAMDGSGHIHENASQFAFPADTLSSQAIRLDSIQDPVMRPLLKKDSIYFSFYFQPQGRGNAPEAEDKLFLEFYSPVLDQWYPKWNSKGSSLEDFVDENGTFFKQVFIPLKDSAKFFHKGFRFRFHNLASMAGSSQPDWQSNADHWNIDLIWIDRDRTITDSSYRKIAFVNQPPTMIKRYQSMPYRQYRNDPTNSMKDTIHSIIIRNMDNTSYTATYGYKIFNQSVNQDSIYDGGTALVDPFSTHGFVDYIRFRDPRMISFFSIYNETKKTYKVRHVINDIGLTGVGDTAIRYQEFANYYAYDDGTPEAGYGFSVRSAKAAMKFQLNTKDTLRQVQFYFNPTLTQANDKYFEIMVWKSIEPEELIFSKKVKAEFTEGMYNFYTYDLETDIVLANEFYIGFRQLYPENLNIGFDYALDSKEYLFYEIGGGWKPSIYSGSLMIRPVFGEKMTASVQENPTVISGFNIFPNPVSGHQLHIEAEDILEDNYQVEIFNITGQKMLQLKGQSVIDVSFLDNGIYLLRLTDMGSAYSRTQKFIRRK